jgi:hypothetical protein
MWSCKRPSGYISRRPLCLPWHVVRKVCLELQKLPLYVYFIYGMLGISAVYFRECMQNPRKVCYTSLDCTGVHTLCRVQSNAALFVDTVLCPDDGMMRRALSITVIGLEGYRPRHGHNGQMRTKRAQLCDCNLKAIVYPIWVVSYVKVNTFRNNGEGKVT